jgi:hypothetical protein
MACKFDHQISNNITLSKCCQTGFILKLGSKQIRLRFLEPILQFFNER